MTRSSFIHAARRSILILVCSCIIVSLFPIQAKALSASLALPAEGDYYIVPESYTGTHAIDVSGGGNAPEKTTIQIWEKNKTDAQVFTLKRSENSYLIVHKRTDLVVNLKDGNTALDGRIWLYHNDGTKSCYWTFYEVSGMPGAYVIQSNNGGKVLDLHNNKAYNGALLHTWNFHAGASCRWKLIPVSSSASASSTSGTLDTNWNLIQKIGKQAVSGPCFTFSLAYARSMIDNKLHAWYEYDIYAGRRGQSGAYADRNLANFDSRFVSSKQNALRDIYERVKAGDPVVINVNGGRSSGEHYVCVVGYTDVTNPAKLAESNFLIIDPAGGPNNKAENLGSLGYKLKWNSGQGYYYCFPM